MFWVNTLLKDQISVPVTPGRVAQNIGKGALGSAFTFLKGPLLV
jgi:hypothetical protein